ncbi:caspase-9 isoform X2 [Podarcis muralis]
MEEDHRQSLRRARLRLVKELKVEPLWDLLLHQEIFTPDMIEEIQKAGTRRDQARQLVIDLQTRGKRALPAFIWCLQETGQNDLAALLSAGGDQPQLHPADLKPVEIRTRSEPRDPRSVEENTRRNAETVYVLRTDPCGYCLIINNVNFSSVSGLSSRAGSDVDCEKLEKRFRSLRFEVLTRRDLKAQEIVTELQSLATRDHSSLDCCLVVLLSHGCQASHIQFPGGIYGTDGRSIAVEKIVSYFNGTHCPSLRGKPKLFFIQACGGEKKDRGFEVDSDPSAVESDASPIQVPAGGSDQTDAVASLPTPSDILVSYSTFPGFVSWRNKCTGSWYVETLDHVLEQYAHSEDLLNMLLRVANAVSAKGEYKQMPGCFNFLRKRFFFTAK